MIIRLIKSQYPIILNLEVMRVLHPIALSYESTEKHSIFAPNDNIAEMVKNRGSTQKPPGTFLRSQQYRPN